MTLKLTQKPSFWAVLDAALPLPPSGQPPPPPYGTSQVSSPAHPCVPEGFVALSPKEGTKEHHIWAAHPH